MRSEPSLSLSMQFGIIVSLVTGLALTGVTWTSGRLYSKDRYEFAQHALLVSHALLARTVSEAMQAGDTERAKNTLQSEHLGRVALWNLRSGEVLHGPPQIPDSWKRTAPTEAAPQLQFSAAATDEFEAAIVSQTLLGGTDWVFTGWVSEASIYEASNRVFWFSLFLSVGAFFLGLFLLLGFGHRAIRPIKELTVAAERITKGDYAVVVTEPRTFELRALVKVFNKMISGIQQNQRVRSVFGKFHNRAVLDRLLSGDVRLGGVETPAVVMFCDLRGFTSLSENTTPADVVLQLNEYLAQMLPIIHHHGGVVDKFMGDAIMAVWGVPNPHPSDSHKAVRAALDMRMALGALNENRALKGLAPLGFGIGIHQGPVISGLIGSEQRLEYTVIGDTVNTASRVESATKELKVDILASSEIAKHVSGTFAFGPDKPLELKGKSHPVMVRALLGLKHASKPEVA